MAFTVWALVYDAAKIGLQAFAETSRVTVSEEEVIDLLCAYYMPGTVDLRTRHYSLTFSMSSAGEKHRN